MSRAPSEATQLRHARSEIRALERDLKAMAADRNNWRLRAERHEHEAADWRRRFDLLLEAKTRDASGSAGSRNAPV